MFGSRCSPLGFKKPPLPASSGLAKLARRSRPRRRTPKIWKRMHPFFTPCMSNVVYAQLCSRCKMAVTQLDSLGPRRRFLTWCRHHELKTKVHPCRLKSSGHATCYSDARLRPHSDVNCVHSEVPGQSFQWCSLGFFPHSGKHVR